MPIRLVVAVTVGAAALGLLVPMLDAVEQRQQTEVTAELDRQQVVLDSDSPETVRIDVVTTDGEPIQDATVLVSGESLPVEDGPLRFDTGPDSSAVSFTVGTDSDADVPVTFRPTQARGTLSLSIVPPSASESTDEMANPEITIRKP